MTALRPRWEIEHADDALFLGAWLFALGDGFVYRLDDAKGGNPTIVCRSLGGDVRWARRFATSSFTSLWVSGQDVHLDGESARRLDGADGRTAAERRYPGPVTGAYPGPRGIVCTVDRTNDTVVLDARTLEETWRWRGPGALIAIHDPLLCTEGRPGRDGVIELRDFDTQDVVRRFPAPARRGPHGHWQDLWVQFAGTERLAVETTTGRTVWRHENATSSPHQGPRFVGDTAYCGGSGVTAYALEDGSVRWNAETVRGTLSFGPEIVGDRVFCATGRGVHVLDRATGSEVASIVVPEAASVVRPAGKDLVVVASLHGLAAYQVPTD